MDIAGTRILRQATVYQPHLIGGQVVPTQLGASMLRRFVRDGVAASALRVPIEPPADPQLDLVVDEGDNPPIEIRGVAAVFAELPWIYFGWSADALTARYGNPTLRRRDTTSKRRAGALNRHHDARCGAKRGRGLRPDGPSRRAPAADRRRLASIRPTFRTCVRFPLARRVSSRCRSTPPCSRQRWRGARVRRRACVDAADRQIPYLVERASEPLALDLTTELVATRPASLPSGRAVSVYRVRLPLEQLPQARVVLTTSARVFTRRVTIGVEHGPDRRRRDPWFETLATSDWAHADQESPAPALTMAVRPIEGREVLVAVEEGDNSPLPLSPPRLLLPSYRLRLFREREAALRLAYGRDDLGPPQVQSGTHQLRSSAGVAATEVVPGPEQTSAPESPLMLMSPQIFWGVLSVAVFILIGLVVRLVRKSDVHSTPAT